MIKRLYVDNYKSLVNFTWEPGSVELLAGTNGSGKSSVFEVIECLRALLVRGEKVPDIFPGSVFTRWSQRDELKIELDLIVNGSGFYFYKCVIQRRADGVSLLKSELLMHSTGELYKFENRKLTLTNRGRLQAQFNFGNSRSYVSEIDVNDWTALHIQFRDALARTAVLKPDVVRIQDVSHVEAERLDRTCSNFVDWYRSWVTPYPERAVAMASLLKTCMPDLVALRVLTLGTAKQMNVEFAPAGKSMLLSLAELSEGQRMLIVLAALSTSKQFDCLLLDEPDNFVGPGEISAIIASLDAAYEKGQLCVISHHPRAIDRLASHSATLFSLENGVTRTRKLIDIDLDGIPLSEALLDQVV